MRASHLARSAAAIFLGLSGHAARADTFHSTYSISLIGIPVGVVEIAAAFSGARYSIEAHAKITGVASLVTSWRSSLAGAGEISGARVMPASFALTESNSTMTRTIRMAVSGNTVTGIDISPPYDPPKGDMVPLSPRDKQGIVDPIGAALLPVPASAAPTSPAACDRTLPVFDGATRFDLALSYVGERRVKTRGYAGPVAVCAIRFAPVAGYRRDRPQIKFWAENKDMEVWLVPVAGQNLLAPYRVSIRTPYGGLVVEATEFTVGEK